ncbi:uncharacterized protein B0I36DRAFT_373476 [Microdochium trichocladiopsis]|uniref:ATP-dependent DNA ligase family profile domain-containing protein n=1 Tax=Microdochium trichocladiopsis TaxID=1682393 RepID=A0A9P8YAV2_9PEZI|nr:uncharacterized protein B0I36DRAFT_373476 [Microdochium trichocladiopsis]KAH7032969.1 hypothetical protein B0I36DRAFT_373476 [Microdochium trichocladiopsis]
MPFPFRLIGDLLESLDNVRHGPAQNGAPYHVVVADWFRLHRQRLHAPETDACAVLSTLLPERRTDRVFFIQTTKLEGIIGQALTLGASRVKELRRHREPGLGIDLADCVEKLLFVTPNPVSDGVTVEAIDVALGEVASRCKFSSPAVRAARKRTDGWSTQEALGDIYRQLSARDAKWFTRLVLKDFQGAALDHDQILRHYHPLLPQMLKIRDDLGLTTAFLRQIRHKQDDYGHIGSILKPKLGVKVGRQPWYKGRSIKHCVDMCRRRTVSCEQKLDGEYCQIHVDRSKGRQCIQIFSKSGKDSTADRIGVHDAIRESLRIGKSDCPFKYGCILEGELLVYSTKDQAILPFHKVRKHVSRSGAFLGTEYDSQPHDYEQLMIVYFDVLLIDNESMLPVRQTERRKRLAELVTCLPGTSDLVPHELIPFTKSTAPAQLRTAFAASIVSRTEGLVLKPDGPYFDFSSVPRPHASGNIKLKKEYVQGWGDVGDFAVVGASYDATKAKSYPLPPPRWTHFYIACLKNRIQVLAKNEKPQFWHINVVELNNTLMSSFQRYCRPVEVAFHENDVFDIDAKSFGGSNKPAVIFVEPLVFDMRCFSFDKNSNSPFWSMRFPMVSKIHFDRSFLDTMTFEELQATAEESAAVVEQEDSQELRRWISGLEEADPRGVAVDAISSQGTFSEACLTPSPVRRRNLKVSRALGAIVEEPPTAPDATTRSGGNIRGRLPMTPPRSSAVQVTEACAETPDQREDDSSEARKCAAEPSMPSLSRKKSCSKPSARQSRQTSAPGGLPGPSQARSHGRSPLSEVGLNISFHDHRLSQTRPGDQSPPVHDADSPQALCRSSPNPQHDGSNSRDQQMRTESRSRVQKQADVAVSPGASQASACPHRGSGCALAGRSVLLSPCIASYAFVSETLLHAHGIDHWTTDPTHWSPCSRLGVVTRGLPASSAPAHSSAPAIVASSNQEHQSSRHSHDVSARRTSEHLRGPKTRKICFVESRRKEATAAFLKVIEETNLRKDASSRKSRKRRRGSPRRTSQDQTTEAVGRRDWVAVYDWHVLEVLTDVEMGKIPMPKTDPWRRFWVGLA